MKRMARELYSLFFKTPEIIVFSLRIVTMLLQSSNVKYRKNDMGGIALLGNGPSCHTTYQRNRNDKEKIMCVNFFAITKEFTLYRPEYYSFIDPELFLNMNEKNLSLMTAINDVDWEMKLFVPYKYKKIIEDLISNKNVEINYIRFNYISGKNKILYKLYKGNLATPKFQNIMVACIYIAINKGFSIIKLHGVEASEFKHYTVNADNEIFLETQHSYGCSVRNMTKEGLIKRGEFWRYLNYYSCMFKGFSQVESYSSYIGAKVYNYTTDSYIDSFEKKRADAD